MSVNLSKLGNLLGTGVCHLCVWLPVAVVMILVLSILNGLGSLGEWMVITLVELAASVVAVLFSMVGLGVVLLPAVSLVTAPGRFAKRSVWPRGAQLG